MKYRLNQKKRCSTTYGNSRLQALTYISTTASVLTWFSNGKLVIKMMNVDGRVGGGVGGGGGGGWAGMNNWFPEHNSKTV